MLDRRDFMRTCSGLGLAGTLFPGVLWAQAQAQGAKKITKEMIENAAAIADVPIADDYKEMMLENLNDQAKGYEEIYKLHIPNSVEPALIFSPVVSGTKFETERKPLRMSKVPSAGALGAPKNLEDLAFASVRELAELVRTKQVSSVALTEMYLRRLKKHDPTLKFVVTLTEERARAQAIGQSRGGAGGKTDSGRAGTGRCLVWRRDAQSVEYESGIERIICGAGFGHGSGMCSVQHRLGNTWLDFLAFDALRMHRAASHVRIGAAHRRDGALLEHGQAWPHLPHSGGLRTSSERDSRAGRQGSDSGEGRVQLGRESRLAKIARRLFED